METLLASGSDLRGSRVEVRTHGADLQVQVIDTDIGLPCGAIVFPDHVVAFKYARLCIDSKPLICADCGEELEEVSACSRGCF